MIRHRTLKISLMLAMFAPQASHTAGNPQVWGYGVKLCEDYLTAYAGWERGDEEYIADYLRYRDWMTGMVTGLSLATGTDVLHGVDVQGAMRRIEIDCTDHPTKGFFNASLDFLKTLSTLE